MTKDEPTDLDRWNIIGPEIADRYAYLGMSQAAFCKAAGISDTYWIPIKRGEATGVPRRAKLAGIAKAIGLTLEDIEFGIQKGRLPDGAVRNSEFAEEPDERVTWAWMDLGLALSSFADRESIPLGQLEEARTAWLDAVREYDAHVQAVIEAKMLDHAESDGFAVAADDGDPKIVEVDGPPGRPSPEPNE